VRRPPALLRRRTRTAARLRPKRRDEAAVAKDPHSRNSTRPMRVDCRKREVGTLRWNRSRKVELRGATIIAESGPAWLEIGRRECSS
jgi:hypothetical protein